VRLAQDTEPAVATMALRRLVALKPARVQPLLPSVTVHRDGGIRRLAVQALLTLAPQTPALVDSLGGMLNDADIDVRVAAQEALIQLAAAETLKQRVLDTALKMVGTDQPRGQEQAILVLGTLRDQRAAPRFLALLDAKEHNVYITAAWGLRRVAVRQTAEAIARRVKLETDKSRVPVPLTKADPVAVQHKYSQLGHLIEALGVMRYRAAEPVLREYIPKPPPPVIPPVEIRIDTVWQPALREAAIWSLGLLHETDPGKDMIDLLSSRLNDDQDSIQPMAAISVGRMKARTALPALRKQYKPGAAYGIGWAAGWALHAITGEAIAPIKARVQEIPRVDWFLEPIVP
jgi:HEAT repeat protein